MNVQEAHMSNWTSLLVTHLNHSFKCLSVFINTHKQQLWCPVEECNETSDIWRAVVYLQPSSGRPCGRCWRVLFSEILLWKHKVSNLQMLSTLNSTNNRRCRRKLIYHVCLRSNTNCRTTSLLLSFSYFHFQNNTHDKSVKAHTFRWRSRETNSA